MLSKETFNFFKNHLNQIDSNYLEIGIYHGDAVSELALLYPNKTIFAIDPFIEDGNTTHLSGIERNKELKDQKTIALNNIKDKSNICLYQQTSKDFYKNLNDELIQKFNIGAVFIDGSHWYEDVSLDYKLALELIGNKIGIICFDDLHIPDVYKACGEFVEFCGERISKRLDLGISVSVFVLKNV